MANTIAGANLAEIAQESLAGLSNLFAPLSALTTDFSADIQGAGESVTTRYPTQPVAADMAAGIKSASQDVTMTSATVSLNQHYGFTYGFTDVERSKSSINLNNLFIEPALQALGDKVFGDVWNLITAANFSTSSTIEAADFGRDDIADLNATLTNGKAPQAGRSIFMNPTYYSSLVKTLNTAEFPGFINEKAEAMVPRVAKFDVYETNLADKNGAEKLEAFAFQRNSLLMAGRGVDTELAEQAGIEVETVVIPGLGLPVQFRRFYDNEGVLYYNCQLLYGVAKGVDYGVRVVSA